METRAIKLTEQPHGLLVPAESIPGHEQWVLEISTELLDEGKSLVVCNIRCGYGDIETEALLYGGDGECAGQAEAIMSVPTVVDGCFALGCPRVAHSGLEHEAGLIDKDKGVASRRAFLSLGLSAVGH